MLSSPRILVVDDEPRLCESLKELLSTQDYVVQTATSGREALEARIASLQQERRDASGFLQESKPELASARMVRLVKTIIARSGGNLQRTQILTPGKGERFRHVTIRVVMTGSVEAVQKIFHGVESGEPYLFLDKVEIRGGRSPSRRSRKGKTKPSAPPLRIRYNVYGFMKLDAS